MTWTRSKYRKTHLWENSFYVIEVRHDAFRVFDRLGRRVVTEDAPTLKAAKHIAAADYRASNLS
jgi:hypothetical protein